MTCVSFFKAKRVDLERVLPPIRNWSFITEGLINILSEKDTLLHEINIDQRSKVYEINECHNDEEKIPRNEDVCNSRRSSMYFYSPRHFLHREENTNEEKTTASTLVGPQKGTCGTCPVLFAFSKPINYSHPLSSLARILICSIWVFI